MKLKIIVLTVMCVITAFEVSGQELLSLSDAIGRALAKNHDVIVARNDAQASRNNVHIGNAGLLPAVDLVADAGYRDSKVETDAGGVNTATTTTVAQIQLSYTLFDGLGNIYTYKKLKAAGQLGELLARDEIEKITLQVSSAYYDVASASEALDIARESLEISRERLERAQRRANFGQANTIDVLSAQVDLNSDSVAFVNAQLDLNQSKRTLNVL